MNPGGSVKDRAAYGIITDAEKAGRLKPGATIVEGTAGNTGIGLAVIGRARGYRTVIVIPNNQSPEKMHLLRTLGAEVKAVPEKPYKDPENYNHIARRLAEERGWFWANQFDNTANRDAHYRSTGPEIWKQTEGKVSAFVAAVGTGGTLAGVSTYLKEQNPKIEIVCADPYGAAMWSWFTNGNLETNDGDSIAEGIGQGRVTKNIEGVKVDRAYRIPDQIGLTIVYQLLREEGLFLGLSSGINVAGAVRFAKESARVKRSLRSFATRARNINQRSSIATGWLPIISIQSCRWNRLSIANLKIFESGKKEPLVPEIFESGSQEPTFRKGISSANVKFVQLRLSLVLPRQCPFFPKIPFRD